MPVGALLLAFQAWNKNTSVDLATNKEKHSFGGTMRPACHRRLKVLLLNSQEHQQIQGSSTAPPMGLVHLLDLAQDHQHILSARHRCKTKVTIKVS